MGILQSLFMCMGDKNVNEEGIRRIISNCWKIQLRNRKRLSMNKIQTFKNWKIFSKPITVIYVTVSQKHKNEFKGLFSLSYNKDGMRYS